MPATIVKLGHAGATIIRSKRCETYIVRIYDRQDGQAPILGKVMSVESGAQATFTNADELWYVIAEQVTA